jgi:hypothetical protein
LISIPGSRCAQFRGPRTIDCRSGHCSALRAVIQVAQTKKGGATGGA